MLTLTIIFLVLLTAINYYLGGKAAFFPAVVFCSVWAIDLLVILLGGSFFYPLSVPTLAIFAVGCLFFSFGSWLALIWPLKAPRLIGGLGKSSSRVLTLIVVGIILAIPLALRWILQISAGRNTTLLGAIYQVLSVEENQTDLAASLFLNLATLSSIVAMVAFHERENGKWRSRCAVLAALVLSVMGGGRTGFTVLILVLICLDWLKNRRMRWKLIIGLGLLLVFLSSAVVYFVQKGDVRTEASLQENLVPIAQTFATYGAGGLVAFDQVIRQPNIVNHNWEIDRFFLQTLDKFGAHFTLPPLTAEFVTIGPHQQTQNVYTLYFAYLDLGYPAMMMIVLLVGFIVTLFYRRAIAGGPVAALFYACFFSGLMLSIYFEPFFFPWNFLLKLWVFMWLLYGLPVAWANLKKNLARVVARDIARSQSA